MASMQDVLDAVKGVHKRLDKMPSLTQITRDVDELRGDLYGNGKDGLKVRLQRQEDFCKNRVDAEKQSLLSRVAPTIVSTVAAAGIIGFGLWLLGLFRNSP